MLWSQIFTVNHSLTHSRLLCQIQIILPTVFFFFFLLILFFCFLTASKQKVGYELSVTGEASSSCFCSVCLISTAVLKPVLMSYNRWGTRVIVSGVWRRTLTSPRCRYGFSQSALLLFVNTFSVLLHCTESVNNKDITSRYEEAAALSRFLFFPPADTPSYVLSQTAHYMLPERFTQFAGSERVGTQLSRRGMSTYLNCCADTRIFGGDSIHCVRGRPGQRDHLHPGDKYIIIRL